MFTSFTCCTHFTVAAGYTVTVDLRYERISSVMRPASLSVPTSSNCDNVSSVTRNKLTNFSLAPESKVI
jgi:hypothetical protein